MAKTPTDIRSLARSHTITAVKTLAGIMEQADAPAAARVAAANSILDRGWGKAEQHITVERVEEISNGQLASELAEVIASLRELGVDAAVLSTGFGGQEAGALGTDKGKPH